LAASTFWSTFWFDATHFNNYIDSCASLPFTVANSATTSAAVARSCDPEHAIDKTAALPSFSDINAGAPMQEANNVCQKHEEYTFHLPNYTYSTLK